MIRLLLLLILHYDRFVIIRSIDVKNDDIETIRERRNSDIDSNDYFYIHVIIINEWEELEAISSLKLIMSFFNITCCMVYRKLSQMLSML
jgi:hypothetical protein